MAWALVKSYRFAGYASVGPSLSTVNDVDVPLSAGEGSISHSAKRLRVISWRGPDLRRKWDRYQASSDEAIPALVWYRSDPCFSVGLCSYGTSGECRK